MEKRTFAGIPEQFAGKDESRVVLIPVPYDGTSTWIKGADKGPDAFLDAAENMELYDIETQTEAYRMGVFLDEPILEDESPEKMTDAVEKRVAEHLEHSKLVSIFGGEHSVSIGALRAYRKRYADLTVLQIDAHADLRPSYEGSACNHACAMYESSQHSNLIQVGIRSMDKSEVEHMDPFKTFFAHDIVPGESKSWIREVIELCGPQVYLTIDLDAFDPAIMPSTGTPEPGGLQFYPVLELLHQLIEEKELVGFDIVELCPNPDAKASDFMAAKLYYKILSYLYEDNHKEN
jgi:agmatinase